jgi:glycine/D-amino acid oxidase-like deaminating enzyme
MYTRWAIEAQRRWERWEQEWGEDLLIRTGRLSFSPSLTESMRSAKATLDRNGVENEIIDHDELAYRWPQVSPEGVEACHYEPTAAAIRAAKACQAVSDAFERQGGELRIARATPGAAAAGGTATLALSDGTTLEAESIVMACGPWLPRLFPELLGDRIATPRRDVFFFGTPAGDVRFSAPHLPNFSEGSQNVYGFPSLDFHGVKVAPTGGMVRFDPDTDERIVAAYQIKRARAYVALRFPALKDQPIIESAVCQLEDTPDSHFVIDRHPRFDNLWVAGGGSGHAFKHGPVLGDYVAARVLGEETDAEMDGLFRL